MKNDRRAPRGAPAVVTGGSRGIGAAVARHLAALGYPMALVYRNDQAAAAEVAEAVRRNGSDALAVKADVSRAEEVERLFETVEAEWGPAAVLVNSAGVHRGGRIGTLGLDDWETVITTNLTGTFLCCRRAAGPMAERGWGRIVNVSSVVGLNGFPGDSAYAAAKAGVLGLTRSLALELAPRGVTVNAVAPGFVDTDMTRGLAPRVLERVVASVPMGRQATSGEVAEAVGFLVTSGYTTGTTVVLDGGWTLA